MTKHKGWTIALLIGFECALAAFAFFGYGTQHYIGQDEPIAFGVIFVAILVLGNLAGLVIALLIYLALRRRRSHY